jgi:hypothetical protein
MARQAPTETGEPPAAVKRNSRQRRQWADRAAQPSWTLRHFDGGPMNRQTPLAVCLA